MKCIYRGYEIRVERGKNMIGYEMLFYDIYRVDDGLECMASYTEESVGVREYMKRLKAIVDEEISEGELWERICL